MSISCSNKIAGFESLELQLTDGNYNFAKQSVVAKSQQFVCQESFQHHLTTSHRLKLCTKLRTNHASKKQIPVQFWVKCLR